MRETQARELLTALFERHAVSPIPITFYPKPITKEEDVSEKLEEAGLGQFKDSVTVRTITKSAFKANTMTGERWIEFYGLPSDHDVRREFKHYLELLGVKYIRRSPHRNFYQEAGR